MTKPKFYIVGAAQVYCPTGWARASTSHEILREVVRPVEVARHTVGSFLPRQSDKTTTHRGGGGQNGAYRFHAVRKAVNDLQAAWQHRFGSRWDPPLSGYVADANLTLDERTVVLSLGAAIDALRDWMAGHPFDERIPTLPAQLWHAFRDTADAFLDYAREAAVCEGVSDEPITESDGRAETKGHSDVRIMTDGQKRLWNALYGRALTAKELAARNELDTSPDVVRQWKRELKGMGYIIERRQRRGSYRPDAPPDDLGMNGPA